MDLLNILSAPVKTGYLDVTCVCIDYCTDQEKYLDIDSRFIHIPVNIYNSWMGLKNTHGRSNHPLFVGLRNTQDDTKKVYFAKVEPSFQSNNSTKDIILLPKWAMNRLGISSEFDIVDMVYVRIPNKVTYIKVKGNNSSYSHKNNIKTLLERKLSNFWCINLGETFKLDDVTFTVTQIKDNQNQDIPYGSIVHADVNFDFDIPDDMVETEKKVQKQPEERVLQKAKNSQIQEPIKSFSSNVRTIQNMNGQDNTVFSSGGIKMGGTVALTQKEIRDRRLALLENQASK